MKMDIEQFRQYEEDFNGLCLACKSWHFGEVEGDAENYPCEYCGENKVMGMHWLLFTNKLEVV